MTGVRLFVWSWVCAVVAVSVMWWAFAQTPTKLEETDRLRGQVLQMKIVNATQAINLLDEQYRRIRQQSVDEREAVGKELAKHTADVLTKLRLDPQKGIVNWDTGVVTVQEEKEKQP